MITVSAFVVIVIASGILFYQGYSDDEKGIGVYVVPGVIVVVLILGVIIVSLAFSWFQRSGGFFEGVSGVGGKGEMNAPKLTSKDVKKAL